MRPASRAALALLLLAAGSVLACSGCRSADAVGAQDPGAAAAAGDGVPADADPSPPQRVVVRLLDDSPELRQAVDRVAADVGRWAEGWSLQVTHGVSGDGAPPPALEILVDLLPLDGAPRRLAHGLPVELGDGTLVLAGEPYPSPDAALALHLPADGAVPRWLVVGHDPRPVARLVAERTFRTAGYPVDGWEEDTDYMLRQAGWQRRAGRWTADGGGVGAHDERDDFADQERWFAGLRRVEAGPLTLLVEPEAGVADGEGGADEPAAAGCGYLRPDAGRLAGELAATVAAMAPRLPIDPQTRLRVAVERDHVEQIRHTGAVGEVTAGGGVAGTADLHLVYHPRDLFAYRRAVARVLLDRAGLGASLPATLREGAALWLTDAGAHRRQPLDEGNGGESSLSATGRGAAATGAGAATTGDATTPGAAGAWYGRPWRRWLLPLAAADVLPTVDELLAEEEPGDGSELLWTPLAAALIDQLPGDTLSAKLAAADLRGAASTLLARLEADGARIRRREAGAAGDRDSPRPAAPPRAASPRAAVPARDPLPPFLAGVSLAMLNDLARGYQSPSVDRALVRLHDAVGANAVSLMPFAYQPDAGQPALRFLNRRPGSETDTAMIHAGRCADARSFTVLWKPQIWVSGGAWPGDVEMRSEADWQAWFRAYRRFLVHQAVLARWSGAEILSVGVELGRTVEREADWRRLIAAVRRVYDGPLTYSANWYGDFDRVPFWDAMDYLGVDAYEPLSADPAATPEELAAGAERVVGHLAAAARDEGKPLLLTELGYAAHQAAWVAPHEEGGTLSDADQAAAYRAFLRALGHPPWLRGVFVWKAFSSAAEEGWDGRGDGGGERADFRFLGRPAETVIRDYYADR